MLVLDTIIRLKLVEIVLSQHMLAHTSPNITQRDIVAWLLWHGDTSIANIDDEEMLGRIGRRSTSAQLVLGLAMMDPGFQLDVIQWRVLSWR